MTARSRLKPSSTETRRYVRRWARNEVNLRADVDVITDDGKRFTTGTAVLRDVSLRGAKLSDIRLRKKCFPARPFRLKLSFREGRYRGVGAVCRPVRFGKGAGFELAVVFEDFWARTE